MFTDWNIIDRSQAIPSCPNCGVRDNVVLIDSKLDINSNQIESTPVWHCSKCSKIFGKREWHVTNTLTSHGSNTAIKNDLSQQNTAEAVAQQLANNFNGGHRLREEIRQVVRELFRQEADIMVVGPITALEQKVEARLAQAIAIESDPLTNIRRQVTSFSLK